MWAYPSEALQRTCTPAQRNRKPVFLICAIFFILMLSWSIFRFSSQFLRSACATTRPCLCFTTKHCSLSFSLSLSFWVVGCAVCGVTIARSNVSRMDPNHKILSSQPVSPPGQGEISKSLIKSTGLVSLKGGRLGNTCTVRIMNVPLFNTFPLLCEWAEMSMRMLIHVNLISYFTWPFCCSAWMFIPGSHGWGKTVIGSSNVNYSYSWN